MQEYAFAIGNFWLKHEDRDSVTWDVPEFRFSNNTYYFFGNQKSY